MRAGGVLPTLPRTFLDFIRNRPWREVSHSAMVQSLGLVRAAGAAGEAPALPSR